MRLTAYLLVTALAVASAASNARAEERSSPTGRYCIAYEPPAGGWPLNAQYALSIRLYPSCATKGELPSDLKVQVDASMPTHRHGSNVTPKVRSVDANRFLISGLLMHMTGDWVIKLTITSNNLVDEIVIPVVLD